MAVHKTKNAANHTPIHKTNGSFVTWEIGDDKGRKAAIEVASKAYAQVERISRATAGAGTFRDISSPNTSVRDGFNRQDYDYFRPGEQLPTAEKEIICACMQAYKRFPIVQNIIDLMADFACQGIDVVHPSPRVEKLYKEWFQRVNGPERTERMLNMLYRAGNVIIKRGTASLPDTTLDVLRTEGADTAIKPQVTIPGGEIPWTYTVLDPRTIEVIGGELAPLLGKDSYVYAMRLPETLVRKIRSPRTSLEQQMVAKLPPSIVAAAKSGDKLVLLDKDKVAAAYYKKDDYQVWSTPLLYPLLDSLSLLNKMKQADRSALDGAIQHIRLWRLGDIKERIFPSPEGIRHLSDVLLNNVGGGTMDLIWGPELSLQETSTDVHHFLGQEKYVPVLNEIFAGLGVPPTLTGTVGGSSGGFTNNFVSLKTLIERLQYGRLIIGMFWMAEFALVQKAFGFRQSAQLVFDHPVLTDDGVEKKLLIDLADRDYISIEYLQERFGAIPEIEAVRLRREARARESKLMPKKAGPFHLQSQQKEFLERVFAQTGAVTPDEVGIELNDRKPGTKSPAELLSKLKQQEIASKPAVTPAVKTKKSAGRPQGAKDQRGRKQKNVTPKSKATEVYTQALLWADEAQRAIAELTQPIFLQAVKKKNMRAISAQEADTYEQFKFSLLCRFNVGQKISEASVKAALQSPLTMPQPVMMLYDSTVKQYVEQEKHQPSIEKARQIQAAVYALYAADFENTV